MSDAETPKPAPKKKPRPAGKRAPSGRRRAREAALQGLYEWLIAGSDAGVVDAHVREQDGFYTPLDVIDGEAGFGVAMSDGPDWEKSLSTLGKTFNICQMTFKNHTCCGHTFAAIDGALALQERMMVAAREIERAEPAEAESHDGDAAGVHDGHGFDGG